MKQILFIVALVVGTTIATQAQELSKEEVITLLSVGNLSAEQQSAILLFIVPNPWHGPVEASNNSEEMFVRIVNDTIDATLSLTKSGMLCLKTFDCKPKVSLNYHYLTLPGMNYWFSASVHLIEPKQALHPNYGYEIFNELKFKE